MEFTIKTATPEKLTTGTLVVFNHADQPAQGAAASLDAACDKRISRAIERGDLESKAGAALSFYEMPGTSCERLLLVSLGKQDGFNEKALRDAFAAAAKALSNGPSGEAAVCLPELSLPGRDAAWLAQLLARMLADATYRYDQTKSEKAPKRGASSIALITATQPDEAVQRAVDHGHATAQGMALTRELGDLPGNFCTPTHLAETAIELGKSMDFKVEVLELEDMEKLGMGSLLSVAKGSIQPPKFIIMDYAGGKPDTQPIVLVGKGITFDTGGISLKPGAEMDEMKYDMCGAATVIGTFKALATMKLPINVVGIVPACENMPSGHASKPGDVVTSMSGQTIEILNTDAEGRLILCDALTYAERFKPDCVIDMATLTGACIIALGKIPSGLMANDDALASELVDCGMRSGDRVWQLPIWDDYQELLKSNFADMANIGGRFGGTITAACFLSRFTKNYKWAHLDIAGTAWVSGDAKGATGRPVPLLAEFLIQRATAAV